jgi:hypothetical protein
LKGRRWQEGKEVDVLTIVSCPCCIQNHSWVTTSDLGVYNDPDCKVYFRVEGWSITDLGKTDFCL